MLIAYSPPPLGDIRDIACSFNYEVCVLDVVEVTSSDSRVYVEGCRHEPSEVPDLCFLKKFSNFNLSVDVPVTKTHLCFIARSS